MKWEKGTVFDLCEINPENISRNYPYDFIRYFDISSVGSGVVTINDEISLSGAPSRAKRIVKSNDTILATVRPGNRSFYHFKNAFENSVASTGFAVLRPMTGKTDPRFLYYLVTEPLFTAYLVAHEQGANYPAVNPDIIGSKPIEIPPLPTQRKIASILSAYDDLIENNLKRIKLLEEKAFLRYKQIVKEEKMENVKLKEVAVLNEESLKSNSTLEKLLYVDIASVSTGCIDNKTEYDIKEAPGRAKRILKHQDIIWSCVRPNRKSYSFVWKPEENLIASTGFAVISAKDIPATFLYQLVITNEFVYYLENHAKGATYPAVTATDFEEATIQVAPDSIMREYHQEVYNSFELKYLLQKQNTKLREARDILLPRLMNGEIEV